MLADLRLLGQVGRPAVRSGAGRRLGSGSVCKWIVDYGWSITEAVATQYEAPFGRPTSGRCASGTGTPIA